MASIKDRRQIEQEVVFRVCSTEKGYKVVEYDGTGLAEGVMSKRKRLYKYGDDAEAKATDAAYRYAGKVRQKRDVPVTVVEAGEVMAEELAKDRS